jgi:hypothetical protein
MLENFLAGKAPVSNWFFEQRLLPETLNAENLWSNVFTTGIN